MALLINHNYLKTNKKHYFREEEKNINLAYLTKSDSCQSKKIKDHIEIKIKKLVLSCAKFGFLFKLALTASLASCSLTLPLVWLCSSITDEGGLEDLYL